MNDNVRGQNSADDLSLRDELLSLINSWGIELPVDLDDKTSLIASGLFDSLALFNLAVWIEKKFGRDIDPTTVDVANQWDSVASILHYVRGTIARVDVAEASGPRPVLSSLPESRHRIIKYEPSYKQALAELTKGLWSSDIDLNLRYFAWKYENNPYTDTIHVYLAFHNDELVGMRGFYPSLWEAGLPPRCFPVLVADDLLVREDHRNRGLVTRIMRAAYADLRESGTRFLFNLSGQTLTVLGSLSMGWRSIGMLKPMGLSSLRGRFRNKLGAMPYFWRYANSPILKDPADKNQFARLDDARRRLSGSGSTGPAIVITDHPRPKEMATLVERIPYDGRIRHVRDESYFDWRFRNPLHDYRFLFAGDETLDGYLVLKRLVDSKNRRVNIVDLEGIDGRVQEALLRDAVTTGAFVNLVSWTATTSDNLLSRLRALGFGPVDEESTALGCPCFLVRPTDDRHLDDQWFLGETPLLDLSNWDIRMLYSMVG
jgi:acyl carrier protein/GNAT superfamily N-acetyltransferase